MQLNARREVDAGPTLSRTVLYPGKSPLVDIVLNICDQRTASISHREEEANLPLASYAKAPLALTRVARCNRRGGQDCSDWTMTRIQAIILDRSGQSMLLAAETTRGRTDAIAGVPVVLAMIQSCDYLASRCGPRMQCNAHKDAQRGCGGHAVDAFVIDTHY